MKSALGPACACLLLGCLCATAADVVLVAGFDDETTENFQNEYKGDIEVTDEYFSVGEYALKVTCEPGTVDVERYIQYSEKDTRIGFHYKADGVRALRVLAGSVEDRENLYFNLTDLPQGTWKWARVRLAELRNVLPRNGPIGKPFGDKAGKGKTFRNIVFHACDLDKKADEPVVYLDNIALYSGKDTVPPALRGAPVLNRDDQGRFLSWPDARDDVGVAFYRLFRGAAKEFAVEKAKPLKEIVIPECTLGREAGWYRVVAVDYDGNASEPSAAVHVTEED